MPTYDYLCLSCESVFDAYASVALRDAERACPACGSGPVKRKLNASFVAGTRGANGTPRPKGGG